MARINETHDPRLRSWVSSANIDGHHFPIQNLRRVVFRPKGGAEAYRGGVANGDQIVDMAACALNVFDGLAGDAAEMSAAFTLNGPRVRRPRGQFFPSDA